MAVLSGASAVPSERPPLIVFVHVPKTAGTTVKRVLAECCLRGRTIKRRKHLKRPEFLEYAHTAEWISGHIGRDTFADALSWSERKIEYYATVRDPLEQLVSHLNFSFERYNLANYLVTHRPEEIKLDRDVMATDFSDPVAVKDLLLEYKRHYLNVQSRLILGKDYEQISESEAARRLASYTFVADLPDLPKLYRAFGFLHLPNDAERFRENASKPHLNPALFQAPELKKFFARQLAYDFRLYALAEKMKWSAEARIPCRPAYLDETLVTHENFDEAAYLNSNDDVAEAVKKGLFTSGRHHFDMYGHREQRKMRRPTDG